MPFIMFIVMIIVRCVTWIILSRLVIWINLGFVPSEIFAILDLDRDLWPKSLLTSKVHAQGDFNVASLNFWWYPNVIWLRSVSHIFDSARLWYGLNLMCSRHQLWVLYIYGKIFRLLLKISVERNITMSL